MKSAPGAKPARPTRVGVISLGCAKNLVDTEVMLGHLDQAGCEFVEDPTQAELIVVNTCAFIDAAREESIRTILEAAEQKKTGTLKRLVVAGCMVQRYSAELRESLPEVDAFVGLDELDQIVPRAGLTTAGSAASDRNLHSDLPLVGATRPTGNGWNRSQYLYDHRTPRKLATPRWSAFVKIAEGCDHTCSFCAIPSFRGTFRSRQSESILSEARGLAEQGVSEICLIAQDSSHFGRDRGDKHGLAELLEALDGVDPLRWVRVHYLYPNTVTDRLIQAMASLPKVVEYVDLPLQHGHPDTLRRMRRGGSADSHLRLLDRFREAMPDVALRSTLIVGFPGETEQEFDALCAFVEKARFDHLGVFAYSHEEQTGAHALADDVAPALKQERLEFLMQLQQSIAFDRVKRSVGRRVEVLVEGAHAETEHLLVGRTRGQAADVDNQVLINDGFARPGSFVEVELTDTAGYDLVGRIIGLAEAGAEDLAR